MTRSARGRRNDGGGVADRADVPKRTGNASSDPSADGGQQATSSGRLGRMWRSFLYDRSVRSRLAVLVLIPLIGALVMGTFLFLDTVERASTANTTRQNTQATVTALNVIARIQDERDVSGLYEAGATGDGSVTSARDDTDAALADLEEQIAGLSGDEGALMAEAVASSRTQLNLLNNVRASRGDELESFVGEGRQHYDQVIQALLGFVKAGGSESATAALVNEVDALDWLARATESASIERGLLAYILASEGDLSSDDQEAALDEVRPLTSEQDFLLERFASTAPQHLRDPYLDEMPPVREPVTALRAEATGVDPDEEIEVADSDEVPLTANGWYEASSNRIDVLRSLQSTVAQSIVDQASTAARSAQVTAIGTAVALVLILALTVLLAYAVARSIVRPLRRLRGAALDAAQAGLPDAVSRINQDGPVVIRQLGDAVTPEGGDEIGQVASAFNEVYATAVEVAGEQAVLRQNLDTIVVNLSRRTQGLVDRQLGEIEALESRERDPDQLGTLFRIDHLATRVRRHAESLLVLAGVEEMRRQGVAAPVLDVVRTAVGEVEQYARVKFGVMPTDLVVPSAVDDIAHLLAELLDNATEFSAPSTAVQVTSQPLLGGGLRLQVTDNGLGIPPDQLASLNERLREPGDIDVASSKTLGIYVVARLASRHGITVRLVPAEGTTGTVAQVDLPAHLVVSPLDTTDGVLQAIQPGSAGGPADFDATATPDQRTASLLDDLAQPDANGSATPAGAPPLAPAPTAHRGSAPPQPQPVTHDGPPSQPQPVARDGLPSRPQPADPARRSPSVPLSAGMQSPPQQPPTARSLRGPEPALPHGDSPIYDEVRSAWFSKGSSLDWSSPADEGWRRAAAALQTAENAANVRRTGHEPTTPAPVVDHLQQSPPPWTSGGSPGPAATPAPPPASAPSQPVPAAAANQSASGLPIRQRGATLVPGSIQGAEQQAPAASAEQAPTDAGTVASTLSKLQRGVSRGREEGGWVPKRPSNSERSSS